MRWQRRIGSNLGKSQACASAVWAGSMVGWRVRLAPAPNVGSIYSCLRCSYRYGCLAFLEGRFWAEEGAVFFHNASMLPWQGVCLLVSYAGYLNLIANLAGVLARHLTTLRFAPYVSTSLALLIQCLPAALIVTSRVSWLQSRGAVLLALLIILTPPDGQEIWMSSIGSQFVLALAAAIVLGMEARSGAVGVLEIAVVAIAPLSGPASWLLTPLFAMRAAVDRSWSRAFQAAAIVAGVVVQLAFFYTAVPNRPIRIAPSLLGAVALKKHVINQFLSPFYTPLAMRGGHPLWI